ncbi:MAG: hypothetical protein ACREWG_17330 [Gammaproteobacteria bacterium]
MQTAQQYQNRAGWHELVQEIASLEDLIAGSRRSDDAHGVWALHLLQSTLKLKRQQLTGSSDRIKASAPERDFHIEGRPRSNLVLRTGPTRPGVSPRSSATDLPRIVPWPPAKGCGMRG